MATVRKAKSLSVPDCKRCRCRFCLFQYNCDQDLLAKVDNHKSTLTFKAGEYLFKEGNEVLGIYVVYSGSVKILRKWDQSKQYVIHLAKEGDLLGIRGLNNKRIHAVSAQTMTATTLCYFPIAFFRKAVWDNEAVNEHFFEYLTAELNKDENRMGNLAYLTVKGRLAEGLLGQNGLYAHVESTTFTISRTDLASFAGTSYETVIRTLKEMEEEGLIKTQGKQVQILTPNTLKGFFVE